MCGTRCLFTETQNFPMHFGLSGVGVKFLKFVETYLYCTNKMKLNISFSCTKAFSYIGLHKIFQMYYNISFRYISLETAGCVF